MKSQYLMCYGVSSAAFKQLKATMNTLLPKYMFNYDYSKSIFRAL